MRRLLVAAASGAVLLLGAGCSTDKSGAAAPAPAPAAPGATTAAAPAATGSTGSAPADPAATDPGGKAANPGDAALAANTDAICRQATKVSDDTVAAFAREAKQLATAKKSADKLAAEQATAGVQRRLQSWSYALGSLSELTSDAALKKSFGTLSGKVEKLSQAEDVSTVKQSQLRTVQADVDKACASR